MIIEKTKRKGAICVFCNKKINSKYRVKYLNWGYSHLACAKNSIEKNFNNLKKILSELKKPKYKKIMILERLE